MSFPGWLEDEGSFIYAATGNLISWSSFVSRASIHSQPRLPAQTLQGEARTTEGGTRMEQRKEDMVDGDDGGSRDKQEKTLLSSFVE